MYQKISERVQKFDDQVLVIVWEALCKIGWDPGEMYEGDVTMDQWAEILYSELSYRHIRAA